VLVKLTLSPQSSVLSTEWETGSRPARLLLLAELRGSAPALARSLLESTWATERADDRAAFLATLARGLSIDDQPLLESALDDRSKEVRRAAAELLTSLPDSRRAQRMLARALPLLAWVPAEKPRMLGLRQRQPAKLEIVLPDVCDQPMIRDGIEPKPPAGRHGRRQQSHSRRRLAQVFPIARTDVLPRARCITRCQVPIDRTTRDVAAERTSHRPPWPDGVKFSAVRVLCR